MNKQMRVKYYSDYDLSLSCNLKISEEILFDYSINCEFTDINDALEKYNVFLVMKSGAKLDYWSNDVYDKLKYISNQMKSKIYRYISNININDIDLIYPDIYKLYEDDFWRLLAQTSKINDFSKKQFSDLINKNDVSLITLLSIRIIVDLFDTELKTYILKDVDNAEVIIDNLLRYRNYSDNKIYLPKSLSNEEQIELISEYVNYPKAKPNYLLLISYSRNEKDFQISDLTKLYAKKAYNNFFDKSNSNNSGFIVEIQIGYADIDEDIIDLSDASGSKFIYSRNWIRENLDNATLLNNFIYVFGFTDIVYRSQFPSKKKEIGILENIIGVNGIRDYKTGMYFNFKERLSDLQIYIYYEELENFNKSIESLYKWFFEEYLVVEFGVKGFFLNIPSYESAYIEKIRMLLPEFDGMSTLNWTI